jgi:hypothetical protein
MFSDSELLPAALRGRLPQGGEKETVKPFWKSILESEENKLVSTFSNGYEVGYLGPNIPNVAFYPFTVVRPTASEYVGFGDCKGSKWSGASAAEKGQIMQYGHRILHAQPQRSHAGSPLVICRPLRPGGTCRAFAAIYREKKHGC